MPRGKLEDLQKEIREIHGLRKVQLRTLQSLLGKLNFACGIIPMGQVLPTAVGSHRGGKGPDSFYSPDRGTQGGFKGVV